MGVSIPRIPILSKAQLNNALANLGHAANSLAQSKPILTQPIKFTIPLQDGSTSGDDLPWPDAAVTTRSGSVEIPDNISGNLGTITWRFIGNTSVDGVAKIGIGYYSKAIGEEIVLPLPSFTYTEQAFTITDYLQIKEISLAVVGLTSGDSFVAAFTRDGTAGADTYTGNVQHVSATLEIDIQLSAS